VEIALKAMWVMEFIANLNAKEAVIHLLKFALAQRNVRRYVNPHARMKASVCAMVFANAKVASMAWIVAKSLMLFLKTKLKLEMQK